MPTVTLNLTGEPRGKQRARFARLRNGRTVAFTPAQTRNYEAMIRLVAQQEMGDRPPFEGPVNLTLRAVFDVPRSWPKRKQVEALAGAVRPGVRDLDNILKAWLDGMNGVVFQDDRQVAEIVAEKTYGPQALVAVTVSEVGSKECEE